MTIGPGDMEDKEIERVARRMAKIDGIDPDVRVTTFAPKIGSRGIRVVDALGDTWPAWQTYVVLARAAIEEIRGKSKVELVSAERPVPYADWLRDVKTYAHDLLEPGASSISISDAIRGLGNCFSETVE